MISQHPTITGTQILQWIRATHPQLQGKTIMTVETNAPCSIDLRNRVLRGMNQAKYAMEAITQGDPITAQRDIDRAIDNLQTAKKQLEVMISE